MKTKTSIILVITTWINNIIMTQSLTSIKAPYYETYRAFNLSNIYTFGHPVKLKILLCHCDCDYNTTLNSYDNQKTAFDGECSSKPIFNTATFCFTKYQILPEGNGCTSGNIEKHIFCRVKVTLDNLYNGMQLRHWYGLNRYELKCSDNFTCPVMNIPAEIPTFGIGDEVFQQFSAEEFEFVSNKNENYFFTKLRNGTNIWSGESINKLAEIDNSKPGWLQILDNDTVDYPNYEVQKIILQQKLILGGEICDSKTLTNWTLHAFGIVNENKNEDTAKELRRSFETGRNLTVKWINFTCRKLEILHYQPSMILTCSPDYSKSIDFPDSKQCCGYNFNPNLQLVRNDSKKIVRRDVIIQQPDSKVCTTATNRTNTIYCINCTNYQIIYMVPPKCEGPLEILHTLSWPAIGGICFGLVIFSYLIFVLMAKYTRCGNILNINNSNVGSADQRSTVM